MQGGPAKAQQGTASSFGGCDHEAALRIVLENHARAQEAHDARIRELEARARDHHRQMTHTTEEARRWKQAHDDVKAAARELSYKTTIAEHKLRELGEKHKNLHENHTAMQAKYHELKKTIKPTDVATENDWQKNAAKWKQRCQDAVNKYEAVSKEAANKVKEHIAARDKALAENREAAAKLKAQVAAYRELQREHEQLKADHRVSTSDNARFYKEHTRLSTTNKALAHDNEQFLARVKQANLDTAELAKLKAEIPAVKAQLAQTAQLQKEVASLSSSRQELKLKHKAAIQDLKTRHADELAALKSANQRIIAATEDELRTAKKNISDKAQEVSQTLKTAETLKAEAKKHKEILRDCWHMLDNAHKVLGVCADFHAKSCASSDTPLFTALSTTCSTVGKFLQQTPV